jgi:AbiV family abortive infection protein
MYIQVSKACVDNADRWMRDADLLCANESYGHAYAALSYADEEVIKAYIFWLRAEGVFPEEYDEQVRRVTLSHQRTGSVIQYLVFGMLLTPILGDEEKVQALRNQYRDVSREELEPHAEEFERELVRFKETMRQRSIYVDVIDGEILSPSDVIKEHVERLKEGIVSRRHFIQQLFEIPDAQKRKIIETMQKLVRNVEDEGR